jgi:hypothetical protein
MMPELIFSLAKQEAASSILFHVVKAASAPAAASRKSRNA